MLCRPRALTLLFIIFSIQLTGQPDQEKEWQKEINTASDPDTNNDYQHLKNALKIAEKWEDSDLRLFENVVRLAEYCSFEDIEDLALCEKGEYEKNLKRAMGLRLKAAPKDSKYIEILLRLGSAATSDNHYRDALIIYGEALELRESTLGKSHIQVSEVFADIAWVCYYQTDKKQARTTMDHALELQNIPEARANEKFIDLLISSARLDSYLEDEKSANKQAQEAAELCRKLWGPKDKRRAEGLRKITHLVDDDSEEKLYLEILDVRKNALSEKSKEYFDSLIDLGFFYSQNKKYYQADSVYQKAIDIRRKARQPDLLLAQALSHRAGLRVEENKHLEAAKIYEEILLLHSDLSSSEDWIFKSAASSVSVQYAKADNFQKAEEYFEKFERDYRLSYPFGVSSLAEQLGDLYSEKRYLQEASDKFEIASATYEAIPDKNNQRQIELVRKLSAAYQQEGRIDEASRMNQQLIQLMAQEVKGSEAPHLIALRNFLKWLMQGAFVFGLFAIAGYYFLSRRLTKKLNAPRVVPVDPDSELIPSPLEIRSVKFHGDGRDLLALRIVNLLIAIGTLGVYSFWGKAKVRRYLCGQAEFEGDRFNFHGKGRELLTGWLKGAPILAFILLLPNIIPFFWQKIESIPVANLLAMIAFLLLWPIARIGAFRYRLNRMSWRGIRFSFDGQTLKYFLTSILGYILCGLTWGIYAPVLFLKQRRYLFNHSRFGDKEFHFAGRSRDILLIWLFAIPILLMTCGIFWPWWSALRYRYAWANTSWNGTRFRCTVSGDGLLWLWVSNLFLVLFTGGLAWSWASLRALRYWSDHITMEGELTLAEVRQQEEDASATGESFADFLGFDFGF